jgi:hypothetical protein
MRKVIIAVLALILVVVGGLALAVINVNALLEENREELARLASDATGREIAFEKAEVAFPGRLSIQIDGLRIAEDPRFGKNDFLALETAYVSVELLPALQNRLELTGLRLDRPTIRVVQSAHGFNFSSLGAAEEGAPSPGGAAPAEDASTSMALAIAGFRILDATILYEDRTSNPPLAITIENFESSGSNIFGTDPIEIAFTGLARPTNGDAKLGSPILGDILVRDLEAGAVDLRLKSPSFHPLLLGLDFEEGDAIERLDSVVLTIAVAPSADQAGYPITLQSSAGHLAGFDYEKLDTTLLYRGRKLDIKSLVVGLAGGNVELAGDMTFGPPGRAPFTLDTKLTALDSGELAAILLDVPRGYVTGTLGGDIDLSGDSLDWETLKKSLAGQVQLEVGEGALEKVNVVDQLVNRLLADPGLGQLAANSIRDVAPELLEGNRTAFNNINLAFDVANGALNADAIELATGEFLITAAGALGLDGAVSGDGKLRFSEELSARILAKADKLAPLLGDGKVVELPLLFGGTTDSIQLLPDLVALTETARENATAEVRIEAAEKLTDAIFGKKKEPVEGEEPTQADKDREAASDLINEGLGRLFGK